MPPTEPQRNRAVPSAGRAQTEDGEGRAGPFWDVMAGRAAPPAAAVLLGWELVAVDPDAGTIEVAFRATEQFLNPVGVVQGGFLAAMLDDTLGPALVATLGPTSSPPPPTSMCSSSARCGRGGWSDGAASCGRAPTSPSSPAS